MIVSDEAFEYLKWQAGDIYDLHADRAKWQAAYEAKLQAQYENIAPWLPKQCAGILDIGSGLGGIDILLRRHYGFGCDIQLLDGFSSPAKPTRSDCMHSDIKVAWKFHWDNDVRSFGAFKFDNCPGRFGLVVSFAAWCFHFAPNDYLDDYLANQCAPSATFILDVRRSRPEWDAQLAKRLIEVAVIHEAPKFQRKVFALAA